VVYTRFFEGVEVGNPSDGYLTATGDNDTSDPYNGMDGTGPWFQQVGGGFSDGGSYGGGTRFPCTYRFSFWRSSYTLGVATIPPASTGLTENVITLTVSTGAVVFPDGRVITSADGAVTLASVPLVSGGALAADPRTNDGTVSFALQCQNTETTFSVQARIRWATQRRQHILYGIVRECYEEGTPCGTACSGSPPPEVLYLTISNFTSNFNDITPDNAALVPAEINGTYVLERIPYACDSYVGVFGKGERCSISGIQNITVGGYFGGGISFWYFFPNSGCFFPFSMLVDYVDLTVPICGSSYQSSGTGTKVRYFAFDPVDGLLTGSFDWVLEA
jgi:hypothetical protein